MRAGAAAAAAVALVISSCGGGGSAGSPTPSPAGPPAERAPDPPSDEQLIEDVLRDRAEALEAGDRRAYLATTTRSLRRADRAAIDRAAALPLRDVSLDPGAIDVDGRRARTRVTLRYGIARVRGMFQVTRRIGLAKVRGRWRVAVVRRGRGVPPWEAGAFAVRPSRHFVVLAPEGAAVDDLLSALEDGYAAMRSRLELGPLRRRYLVIAAADPAQARALTTEIRGLESLTAISDATINERGPARAVSQVVSLRLLVVYSTFARLDAEGRRLTIAHELTHAALAGSTSGRTPAWLVEGVAMFVSGDRRVNSGGDIATLSSPTAIARLSGEAQARAYDASSAAAFAIVDRFGARRLLALYDAFNDPRLAGPPGRRLVDRALRRELGMSLRELSG